VHDAILTIRMEHHPGVLARIAAMLHRRAIDIGALRAAPTPGDARLSELVVEARGARTDLERLALALANLVDVHDVRVTVHEPVRSGGHAG
jgi:acetolactate synthase small subunit